MKNTTDFTAKERAEIDATIRAKALADIKKYADEIDELRKKLISAQAHYDYASRIYEAADNATRGGAR